MSALTCVRISKVKAHLSGAAVERGEITAGDRSGNAMADALARRGAEYHRVPEALRQELEEERLGQRHVLAWIGRGLELAATMGSLPPPVAAGANAGPARAFLYVEKDAVYMALQSAKRAGAKVDTSHRLVGLPGLVFCDRCGGYASVAVRLLGSPCLRRQGTRTTYLASLRDGRHPQTDVFLGTPVPLDWEAVRAAADAAAWGSCVRSSIVIDPADLLLTSPLGRGARGASS